MVKSAKTTKKLVVRKNVFTKKLFRSTVKITLFISKKLFAVKKGEQLFSMNNIFKI